MLNCSLFSRNFHSSSNIFYLLGDLYYIIYFISFGSCLLYYIIYLSEVVYSTHLISRFFIVIFSSLVVRPFKERSDSGGERSPPCRTRRWLASSLYSSSLYFRILLLYECVILDVGFLIWLRFEVDIDFCFYFIYS